MNRIDIRFSALIENEAFARTAVATFIAILNPTLEELIEVKTIVAEAVSNSIIHGYNGDRSKDVYLRCTITKNSEIELIIQDYGVGISDIEQARQMSYTSKPEQERSGMGFTIMETLSDSVDINSIVGLGTKIIVKKTLKSILEEVK